MKAQCRRQSALLTSVSLVGAGVGFVAGVTGWASEVPLDEASALLRTTELGVHMGSAGETSGKGGLASPLDGTADADRVSGERIARIEHDPKGARAAASARDQVRSREAESFSRASQKHEEQAAHAHGGRAASDPVERLVLPVAESEAREEHARFQLAAATQIPARGPEDQLATPAAKTVPQVEVRASDHGDYERIEFEWPEEVGYEVVQHAQRVTVAFSRTGRIDLSSVRAGDGDHVVEARSTGGAVTDQVVLQVVPDARVRTYSAGGDRIVGIDVYAETPTEPVEAQESESVQASVQALREALEQRDAVIDDLLTRVEQLEQTLSSDDLDRVLAGQAGSTGAVGGAPAPRLPAEGATVAQAPGAPPSSSEPAPAPSAPAGPAPEPAPTGQAQGSGGTNAPAKPGQFEVVEEEIDRALERTLVQTGVLLLPFGQAEIEPYFDYTRREDNLPVLFADNGSLSLGNQEVRRNEFVTGQELRVGLPFDSQIEFGLPYNYVDQSVTTPVGNGRRVTRDGSGHGLGDLRVGLAKTLIRENGGWWPDLVARITWDTATGNTTENDVVLGGGFNELRGSLSAIKRQDPLAFVAGMSYEKTFENDNVEPGDALGFNIGTVLAASPGTSLRLGLNQSFIDNTKIDGQGINGSDSVIATATLGASVILGPGVLLDISGDIGLTDDAPDYAARASLPIRFNLPVY